MSFLLLPSSPSVRSLVYQVPRARADAPEVDVRRKLPLKIVTKYLC